MNTVKIKKSEPLPFSRLNAADKAIALVFAGMVYAAPFLPEIKMYSLVPPKPSAYLALGVLLVLSVVFRQRLKEKAPVVFYTLAVIYYFIVIAYLWVIIVLISFIRPAAVPVLFLWAFSAFLWYRIGIERIYFAVHLAASCILIFLVARRIPEMRFLLRLAIIPYLIVGVVALARPRAFGIVRPIAVVFFIVGTVIHPLGLLRYLGLYPETAPRVAAQPGVEQLYGFDHRAPYGGAFGADRIAPIEFTGRTMILPSRTGDLLLLGSGKPGESTVEKIALPSRAGNMALIDPARPDVAFVGGKGALFRVGAEPFRLLDRVPVRPGLVNMLRADAESRKLYAVQDNGRSVLRFDMDDPSKTESSKDVGRLRWIFDIGLDPERRRFFCTGFGPDGMHILEGRMDDLALTRDKPLGDRLGLFMETDPAAKRIYFISIFTFELVILDMDSLEIVRSVPLDLSVAYLTFDPARRLLYISVYFNNHIIIYDPDNDRIVGRLMTGPMLRHTDLSADGRRLYWQSNAGVFRADLDAVLSAQVPGKPPDWYRRQMIAESAERALSPMTNFILRCTLPVRMTRYLYEALAGG